MNGKTIIIKEQLYLGKMIVCLALSYVKSKQAKKKKKYVYIFLLDFKTFLNNLYNERSVLKYVKYVKFYDYAVAFVL